MGPCQHLRQREDGHLVLRVVGQVLVQVGQAGRVAAELVVHHPQLVARRHLPAPGGTGKQAHSGRVGAWHAWLMEGAGKQGKPRRDMLKPEWGRPFYAPHWRRTHRGEAGGGSAAQGCCCWCVGRGLRPHLKRARSTT